MRPIRIPIAVGRQARWRCPHPRPAAAREHSAPFEEPIEANGLKLVTLLGAGHYTAALPTCAGWQV
ncbi:hypothetical protein [Bradyrhizobium japonicum]|uniref:hypothetical protein n=1 Tax=Bradyrhizobium japonicum TaxID=375 RepID=UPI001BA7BBC4|nr:hypothetical protein [Bradyrhizobium japonicum]MBR0762838.1 hypothetical protein [Bradyrhizobium japonicum]